MIEYLSILLAGHKAKMDERGASAVEYGLLVAGIAAVIVAVVITLGGQIQAAFQGTSDKLPAAPPAGG
jgi:pilus assembly protein Flp/PilA